MRFVPRTEISIPRFQPHELLFLDCWYGLTHEKSLDSYRVRCLNARSVVRELCDEVTEGRIDQPEFQGLCGESLAILQSDPILALFFRADLPQSGHSSNYHLIFQAAVKKRSGKNLRITTD